MITVIRGSQKRTKVHSKLKDAVTDASRIGLMEHAKEIELLPPGMAYSLELPDAFDWAALECAQFSTREDVSGRSGAGSSAR